MCGVVPRTRVSCEWYARVVSGMRAWRRQDPNYIQTGHFDTCADAYALGVTVLMLLTGWSAVADGQVLAHRCQVPLTCLAPLTASAASARSRGRS